MSNVLLFYETLMINILPKIGNASQACEEEIYKQRQIKQRVFAWFKPNM
jgi:hypothetical protein